MNKFRNTKCKKAWVALKLDIKKSYDRVEWDFLFDALHKLGFHPEWIDLIKTCIWRVSYYIIINDNICGFFTLTKGIWQGILFLPIFLLSVWEFKLGRSVRRCKDKNVELILRFLLEHAKFHVYFLQMIASFFAGLTLNPCKSVLYYIISIKILVNSLIFINRHSHFLVMHPPMTIVSSIFNIKH